MTAFQGAPRAHNVHLTHSGTAVTGLAHGDVTVSYLRTGDTVFQSKTLTSMNFAEVGLGFYTFQWDGTELTHLGPFLVRVTGSSIDPYVDEFDIDPVTAEAIGRPSLCVVSGSVLDITGVADPAQRILVRPATYPAGVGASLVTAKSFDTVTDAYGNFTVGLVQGMTAIIEIPFAGIKQQISIPVQSTARLIDLLPPLPQG